MDRNEFIKGAEQRAQGYLQRWLKNEQFRAAVTRPNPSRPLPKQGDAEAPHRRK